MIIIDDAHAGGTLGKTGKGTAEVLGIKSRQIIQTISMSKAFGVYGGAILGNRALRQKVLDRSALFVGHTPLPLPLANAAIESIGILKKDRRARPRLRKNIAFVKDALAGSEFETHTPGPIVPIIPPRLAQTKKLNAALLKAGIHPPFIRYPATVESGYFRFVISSEHSAAQLSALVEVLRNRAMKR